MFATRQVLCTVPTTAPGMSVEYRSTLDPVNPDDDATAGEFSGDDYPPKFYTQIMLAVDTSHSKEYRARNADARQSMRLQGADLHDIHHRYYRPWE